MDEFIKKIILGRTIQAAFQRGNVYDILNSINKKEKDEVKYDIKKELIKISRSYVNNVSEKRHIKNIKYFAYVISQKHGARLKNGTLRIGTAQKLLNVYIKFLWCLGIAKEPMHCPIDRIVLRAIHDNSSWTDIRTMDEYMDIIRKIREHIGNLSIAKWEWNLWNQKT